MKLFFVINSLGSGGAERVVSLLSGALARRGHEVTIVLRQNSRRDARYSLSSNISIIDLHDPWDAIQNRFPSLGPESRFLKLVTQATPRQISRRAAGLLQRLRLRKLVLALRPDAVLAFMVTTNIETTSALRNLDVPVIVSERSDPGRFDGNWVKRFLRNKWYGRATGLVFQTQDALEFFRPAIRNKSTVIYNPLELPPELVRSPETGLPRIVSVGRLVASKRFDLVIQAVARLSSMGTPCRLEIYGEGPEQPALEALVAQNGLQEWVSLKGFSANVLADIKDAAAFVLASTYEGMPNALLEAMGLGVPCVSSDCPIGGPRAVIRHNENGLLFPMGDLDALVGHLRRVLSEPEWAARLGGSAQLLKDQLSIEKIADRWEAWVAKTIEESR